MRTIRKLVRKRRKIEERIHQKTCQYVYRLQFSLHFVQQTLSPGTGYCSLQIRCLKLTTTAHYACAFDCTNLFTFRQCACVLMEKLLKKWTTDLQITVHVSFTELSFQYARIYCSVNCSGDGYLSRLFMNLRSQFSSWGKYEPERVLLTTTSIARLDNTRIKYKSQQHKHSNTIDTK